MNEGGIPGIPVLDGKILIVDDNPANIALLRLNLKSAGYRNVTTTTDSREVVNLCTATHYDLILLDIDMPYLDGFGVMAQLAPLYVNDYMPILVLTADRSPKTRQQALQSGAKDFASKPYDLIEVLTRIKNLLEVRLLYGERTHQAEILEEKVRERTRQLDERNRELELSRREVIRRLGRAGEYRDNETGQHVIRMSKFSFLLALEHGLDKYTAELILDASPLHDVGKIGIRDAILLKPGKLDADEFTVMKTHVDIGADLLGDHSSDLMKMAQSIAATHHEKWDGSGYPNGLKGNEIPLEGRICAICDVFDALTSSRPYKAAWPIDQAVSYVKEQAGKHFDPDLVTLFIKLLPDVLAIRQVHTDNAEDSA